MTNKVTDLVPQGIDPIVWKTATQSMYPGIKPATIEMAIDMCKKDNVDIRMKTLHIISRGGVEKIEPSVAHYRILAKRTGRHVKTEVTEWGPNIDVNIGGKLTKVPEFCTVTIWEWNPHTKQPEPWPHTEWFVERYNNSPLWNKSPKGMLQVRTESLALRKVFPDELGGMYTFEEMEDTTEVPEKSNREVKEVKHEPLKIQSIPKETIDFTNFLEEIQKAPPSPSVEESVPIIKAANSVSELVLYKDLLTDTETKMSLKDFGDFVEKTIDEISSKDDWNYYNDLKNLNIESFAMLAKKDPTRTISLREKIAPKKELYEVKA